VCEYHECSTMQIKPNQGKANFEMFYLGKIYSEQYIQDCIKSGKLCTKDDFMLVEHKNEAKCLTIGLSKKKRFTMMEGVIMYDVMGGHSSMLTQNEFWRNTEASRLLPERTHEQMKKFYQKQKRITLENFLVECLHDGVEFCFSHRGIPSTDFEERFRDQYSTEFAALEGREAHEFNSYYGSSKQEDDQQSVGSSYLHQSSNNSNNVPE